MSVTIGDNTYTTEAGIDGSFKLPVQGLVVGTPVEIVVGTPPDRLVKTSYTPTV